jgi:hypothetical protein
VDKIVKAGPKLLSEDEARLILGVPKEAPKELIIERYEKLFAANDPTIGGSKYIQDRIANAHRLLIK